MRKVLTFCLLTCTLSACSFFHSKTKTETTPLTQTASSTEENTVIQTPTPTPTPTSVHKKKQKYFYYRAKHRCLEKELHANEKLEDCIKRLKSQ